jgi:hypothetical protein
MLFFLNGQREDVFDRGFSVFLSVAFSGFGSLKGEMGIDVAKSKHSGPYGDVNEKRKSPLQPFFFFSIYTFISNTALLFAFLKQN